MSEIKVNKLTPRTACGTTTLGDSGDTFNIPAGVTISNNGTATGFGATGAVNWDVASIKTTDFTAVSGVGYFVDTATTGAVIVTLPAAPSVGDVVGVADYANNFADANCTLNRNSLKIGGLALNGTLETSGIALTLVYVDVTKGWIVTDSGLASDAPTAKYVAASGGCITTCGNYKIHTFNSPNTFVVTCAGNTAGSNTVDYLIMAGGGGGAAGGDAAGGGGAGGYRFSDGTGSGCYTAGPAPLSAAGVTVSATPYPVSVGGGGAGSTAPTNPGIAANGTPSDILSLTATGGGSGGGGPGGASGPCVAGVPGGSGGGAATAGGASGTIGSGNTPPTTPPQGFDGGTGASDNTTYRVAGGGGGAGGAGGSTTNPAPAGGVGGAGLTNAINGSAIARGGGGGGGGHPGGSRAGGAGGSGGGGAGSWPGSAGNGTQYYGAGGGGGGNDYEDGGNGGDGAIIIRYKYQ